MAAPSSRAATLYARDDGEGPPVVLLHGVGGDHTVWNGVIGPLAEEFRVVAPDLRGHGRSKTPDGSTFSFAEMEADLEAMLAEREIDSAHFVGLSAGGFLTLRLSLDRPLTVRSQVLIAASSHCDAHARAVQESWAETFRTEGLDAFVLRVVKDVYYPEWAENHLEVIDRLREQVRERDTRAVLSWGAAAGAFDLRGRLGKMRTPTLVVQGMDDRVMDPSHARLLRQTIPGSELKLFASTGHMVPVERPEETTALIREFVRKVESARAAPSPA